MKRYNNLFDKIVSLDNLYLADKKARRNKSNRKDIKEFDQNKEESLKKLQQDLINGTYKTSEYNTFIIREPKERLIFRLPYYPDRIVHHAVMNIMEPIWVSIFIKDTYSCIKHMCSHIGWLKHCNGINLLKKILRYKELLVYARRFSKQKL